MEMPGSREPGQALVLPSLSSLLAVRGKCCCVLNHFGSFDSDWSFRALFEFGGRVAAAVQVYAIRQQNKKTHQRTHFFPSVPAKNSPVLVTRAPKRSENHRMEDTTWEGIGFDGSINDDSSVRIMDRKRSGEFRT
ncbi:hypothetical protein L204_102399 [Cryptococcus depauperatus]